MNALDKAGAAALSARVAVVPPGRPFDAARTAVLKEFSSRLFADREIGHLPEVRSLAFALRKAQLTRLRREFEAIDTSGTLRVPRGIVMHFAPANVDTVGMYSWVWSFLVGNCNITRVSERRSRVARQLENRLAEVLASDAELAEANYWVTYPHERAITEVLSNVANVRMIWGGDEAIREIRKVVPNQAGLDVVFRDRVSITVLQQDAVAALDAAGLREIAARFTADVVMFDQAACSSPCTVYWLADPDRTEVRERFWAAVVEDLRARGYLPPEGAAMRKLTAAAIAAARGQIESVSVRAPGLTLLESSAAAAVGSHDCGWGLLEERIAPTTTAIYSSLHTRVQTVATFGLDAQTLRHLAAGCASKGVDRIVPVGSALIFGRFWDGYDLFEVLTRHVAFTEKAS